MKKNIIWSNDFDATREENWQEAFGRKLAGSL